MDLAKVRLRKAYFVKERKKKGLNELTFGQR